MTDEELAEKYVDTLLSKDNVEVDNFLDENLGDLKLTEKQCGTLLGIIKGVGITSFLAGLKADVHTDNSKVIAELKNEVLKLTNENKILKQGKTNVFAELNDETAESNEMLMDKVADLEAQIEKMKCCGNCNHYDRTFELCYYSMGDEDYDCRGRKWEKV